MFFLLSIFLWVFLSSSPESLIKGARWEISLRCDTGNKCCVLLID
jgi:plastocyanin domain-containing protein